MRLPEGFSCRHSNPIRYIVREASHPVISATVACSRRGPVGIHRVYSVLHFYLLYIQSYDFVSHLNTKLSCGCAKRGVKIDCAMNDELESTKGAMPSAQVICYNIELCHCITYNIICEVFCFCSTICFSFGRIQFVYCLY